MQLAKSVSVNTAQGGYSINLGKLEPWKQDSPEIDRIEVYFQEYPDHAEMTIHIMSAGKTIRMLWNCPVDITYLTEEPTHD
jgi:hypothetical protein